MKAKRKRDSEGRYSVFNGTLNEIKHVDITKIMSSWWIPKLECYSPSDFRQVISADMNEIVWNLHLKNPKRSKYIAKSKARTLLKQSLASFLCLVSPLFQAQRMSTLALTGVYEFCKAHSFVFTISRHEWACPLTDLGGSHFCCRNIAIAFEDL